VPHVKPHSERAADRESLLDRDSLIFCREKLAQKGRARRGLPRRRDAIV